MFRGAGKAGWPAFGLHMPPREITHSGAHRRPQVQWRHYGGPQRRRARCELLTEACGNLGRSHRPQSRSIFRPGHCSQAKRRNHFQVLADYIISLFINFRDSRRFLALRPAGSSPRCRAIWTGGRPRSASVPRAVFVQALGDLRISPHDMPLSGRFLEAVWRALPARSMFADFRAPTWSWPGQYDVSYRDKLPPIYRWSRCRERAPTRCPVLNADLGQQSLQLTATASDPVCERLAG
jgi:hypothetical protein